MSIISDLAAFPNSGPYSISGFSSPSNSGAVPVTELRNLLDSTWSSNAMDRAVSLAKGNTMSASCFTSNGIVNANGSALGILSNAKFDLNGMNSVLKTTGGSISGVIGDLQTASSLQSLAAGLAKSVSSVAGAVFGLLDRALSAASPLGEKLMSMASGLMGLAGKAVDLFAGAFQLAGKGLLGLGDFSPGEVFSGLAGKLGGMAGGIGNSILSLAGNAGKMASDLLGMGIDALMSPSASLNSLASMFSPITGALSGIGKGVGNALSSLNMDTLKGVASKIGDALAGVIGGLVDGIASAASALLNGAKTTIDRFQGVTLIDGEWKNNSQLSKLAGLGLSALLGLFATKSKSKSGKVLLGGSAAMVLLATLLGNSAPVSGSFLASSNGGWLGSSAAAAQGVSGSLAEACAFNAAMMAALSGFLTSGTSSIDGLMSALECRRSTYNGVYGNALSAQQQTDALLQRLLGMFGLLNGGNYPATCAGSGLGLGRCS
jgi:hypothetical protein